MAASLYQQWQYTLLEWRHSPCKLQYFSSVASYADEKKLRHFSSAVTMLEKLFLHSSLTDLNMYLFPGLMRPVSMFLLIIMLVFSLLSLALNIPTWLLGFLLAPVLSKGTWLVEFLYPLPIARWGHLFLLRWSQPKVPLEDKAASYHSRTLEQRVEVVPERVYVHPIPQLLDNLGYLVVCLAPPVTTNNQRQGATPLGTVSVLVQQQADPKTIPIVAFVVDCGDAESMQEQVQLIHKTHYPEYPAIRIQMILSTHKHHDHTAGNLLWNKMTEGKVGQYLDHIVGGAVEKVPGCNMPVADGDRLTLPSYGSNDLNEIANVEVVAVPAHTRGSVAYLLRANSANTNDGDGEYHACFAFTGDTMFSGGGGVPFEAGSDSDIDRGDYKDDAHADIRADRSTHAVERCFAEILYRGMSTATTAMSPLNDYSAAQDHFLVFPGHEYTTELLTRQFGVPPSGNIHDANKWKNFPPHVFFETVSQLYVALHRRSLPQATGKVLAAAPTTLRRELLINPHLRSLARRAELVVHAIRFWDAYFSKPKGPKDEEAAIMRVRQQSLNPKQRNTTPSTLTRRKPSSSVNKTPFNPKRWNMDTGDAAQTVFTTLYTTDLDAIIDGLSCGKLDPEQAAIRLEGLKTKLSEPVIRRRPIPGTLPSERVVHKGLVGFALLVSSSCG